MFWYGADEVENRLWWTILHFCPTSQTWILNIIKFSIYISFRFSNALGAYRSATRDLPNQSGQVLPQLLLLTCLPQLLTPAPLLAPTKWLHHRPHLPTIECQPNLKMTAPRGKIAAPRGKIATHLHKRTLKSQWLVTGCPLSWMTPVVTLKGKVNIVSGDHHRFLMSE
jgi:hypothetical protein